MKRLTAPDYQLCVICTEAKLHPLTASDDLQVTQAIKVTYLPQGGRGCVYCFNIAFFSKYFFLLARMNKSLSLTNHLEVIAV